MLWGVSSYKLQVFRKKKKKVILKVKAQSYSERSRELNDFIEDNEETLKTRN